jgi:hypothetical protein
VAACLAIAGFYVRLSEPRITDAEVVLSAIATVTAGWGLALLIPDRYRRWSIGYMAIITPIVLVITVVLVVKLPD